MPIETGIFRTVSVGPTDGFTDLEGRRVTSAAAPAPESPRLGARVRRGLKLAGGDCTGSGESPGPNQVTPG